MNVILSSAYWPNLIYLSYFLHANSVMMEQHEHFQKQSYRNRCLILSANGTLPHHPGATPASQNVHA